MKLIGRLTVQDFRTGEIIVDKKNVITNFGKQRAAERLGGLNANAITMMGIGDGGAPVGSPQTPDIALATNTGLDHELTRTGSVNPTIVGSNTLRFQAVFLTSPPLSFADPALHAINEAGLFCADDVQPGTPRMFARNCFPSVPFNPGDREGVVITWSVAVV